MPLLRRVVKKVQIDYLCPECMVIMKFERYKLPAKPAYPHKCPRCRTKVNLAVIYPYTTEELNDHE